MPNINLKALHSDETELFHSPLEPKAGDVVTIRFRTAKDDVDEVVLVCGKQEFYLEKENSEQVFSNIEINSYKLDIKNDILSDILQKYGIMKLGGFVMENNNFDKQNSEYKMYCIEYPNCNNLSLEDNVFVVNVKKGLAIDVIGESKLLVQVSEVNNKEEELGININYMNR